MPNSLVKSISKQTGNTKPKIEKEFKEAEKQAEKSHVINKYAYATAVTEKINKYKPKSK